VVPAKFTGTSRGRDEEMAETSVDIDMEQLGKVREILGTESIRETISAAFREVIRMAAVRDLVTLGESGAFDFLLERDAEERMWGSSRRPLGPTA
jgi:Arc/MetJ family transcription regulator